MNVITQFPAAPDYPRHLRFEAMFEGAAIGIGICELNGWILEANPALSQMLGYSQQELTGAHAGELYPEICRRPHPDTAYTGNLEPGNLDARNRSLDERLLGELMRGERSWFEIEKRYRRKDGSELCGHLTVSLWCDARSQPAFLIAMLADATERRRVEAHLRQAEKMEVIGRLAGGIAHDFNNLLTGILLYCDLLSAGLSGAGPESGGGESGCRENNGSLRIEPPEGHGMGTSELCQHVEEVRVAGQQGAALTQQLLAIARQQPAELRPVPINEIVVSTENLLRRLIGERIELITALDSGAGVVLVDPAQLRQVLLNLVLNARDALPMGGKIRLITRSAEFPGMESPGAKCAHMNSADSNLGRNVEPASSRRAVSLTVKDNGCGMDAETRARLFEPFFTTKNPGAGTGLGLATVERIVSEAGGMIEVESEPGRGTLIEVLLPAIETSSSSSPSLTEEPSDKVSSRQPYSQGAPPSGVPKIRA